MSEILKLLHSIQKSLSAPKGQKNNFGGWNFRSCEDIIEALKNILPDDAVITMSDEMFMLGERYYNKATATFHYMGETISATANAREDILKKGMDLGQLSGSISSYSRKYALQGLFCIDNAKHEPVQDLDSLDNGQTLKALQDAYMKKESRAVFEIDSKTSSALWREAMQALSNDEYEWVQSTLDKG